MSKLMFGNTEIVSGWAASKFDARFSNILATVGALDKDGTLIGAAVLHDHTRYDVELSYYGAGTLSLDMCKAIAWLVFEFGKLQRVSICVARRNKKLTRALPRIGWVYEGCKRRQFGPFKGDDGLVWGILRKEAGKFLRGKDGQISKAA